MNMAQYSYKQIFTSKFALEKDYVQIYVSDIKT